MIRRPFLPILFAVFAIASVFGASAASRPNILLILADDMGFSDLGCYGGEIDTPNLDALAAGGARFTQFYSTGRCCPSRGCLMSGQYPHRVGLGHMVKDLGRPGYAGRISDRAVTIAEALNVAGYRSFMSGKWHLGTPDPTRHGFEEFYGTLVSAKTFWDPDHFTRLPAGRPRRHYEREQFYGTDALTDHALEFLGKARKTPDRPWFLYLAYNAPHFPLHAPAADIAKYADRYQVGWDRIRVERLARMKRLGIVGEGTELSPRSPYWDWLEDEPGQNPAWADIPAGRRPDLARRMAIYAAMIDCLDRQIGRVLRNLKQSGEFENTLILFLSDNGACAEWDPHGFDIRSSANNILHRPDELDRMGAPGTFHSVGSAWANASNTPWRLYKHYNHEGGISGPFIAHWPRGIAARGSIVRGTAHLIDVMPTLLSAAGATYPDQIRGGASLPLPGEDLLPVIAGGRLPERNLFFEHEGNRAIRRGPWKAVSLYGKPWELYRIDADRTELIDLAGSRGEKLDALTREWMDWARELDVIPHPRNYGVGYLRPR